MTFEHPKGYLCEFIDFVPADFYCHKCSLVARKLTYTSCCGESYCYTCIAGAQQENEVCQACGQQNFTTLQQIKYQQRIKGLQVYCSMKERGCDWSGTLQQLDSHLDPDQDNSCQHMDIKCPLNCDQAIPRSRVEQHMAKECAQREHACQHCFFKDTYQVVVDIHMPECDLFPLQCPNLCGVTCERSVMENHISMCLLEEVECEFSGVGCDERLRRGEQEEHSRHNSQKHLSLTTAASLKMNLQLQQKLQEQEQNFEKTLQEIKQCLQGQEQKLSKQKCKMEEQEQTFQRKVQKLEELVQEHDKKVIEMQEKSDLRERAAKRLVKEVTHSSLKRSFLMEHFEAMGVKDLMNNDWMSPAMYTHAFGYKFCIGVQPNHGKKMKVRLSLYATKGEYDHQLKWPAKASFTIELLNQQGGVNKETTIGGTSWDKPDGPYCVVFSSPPHCGMLHRSKIEDFLRNDTLYFHISNINVF